MYDHSKLVGSTKPPHKEVLIFDQSEGGSNLGKIGCEMVNVYKWIQELIQIEDDLLRLSSLATLILFN